MTNRYKHPTYYARHTPGKLRKSGHGVRQMARIMGFSLSTISGELRRNRHQLNDYSCHKAQDNTKARRRVANRGRAKLRNVHFGFIREQVELTLSPEQIASLFPAKFKFTISPKAITTTSTNGVDTAAIRESCCGGNRKSTERNGATTEARKHYRFRESP